MFIVQDFLFVLNEILMRLDMMTYRKLTEIPEQKIACSQF